MKRPNFFIVGAPKCGTTAMYAYLRQHPEVFMPEKNKEPHFFATDLDSGSYLDSRYFIRDPEQYLALFAGAQNEKRVGEASVWYLYSRVAAARIKEFEPQAKIIIMLRHPVDMIYSLHAQRLHSGAEDIVSFEAALQAESERKQGRRLPKHTINAKGLLYRETAKYTEQVQRYLDLFGSGNVQVIIFDDFRSDTPRIFKETCAFLEINPDFQPDFRVVNPNTVRRSRMLQNLLRSPYPAVERLGRALLPSPLQQAAKRVLVTLNRLNSRVESRPPMNPQLRKQLQAEFAPEVERLSALLGRDLTSIWT